MLYRTDENNVTQSKIIVSDIPAQFGSYSWEISPEVIPAANYKISIYEFPLSYEPLGQSDRSDNYFSIVKKTHPSINEIDIFLFKDFKTCIVGDKCTSDCVDVKRDNDTVYMSFENNSNLKSLKPSDSTLNNYEQKICLNFVLDNTKIDTTKREFQGFISNIYNWSGGSIDLLPKFVEISATEIELSKLWGGFWVNPSDVRSIIKPYITKNTDFVFVLTDLYDEAQDLSVPPSLCGGTYAADNGVGGAGYTWVPTTQDCFSKATLMHEFLHQLGWALHFLVNITDIYFIEDISGISGHHEYPDCDKGDSDHHLWFPDTYDCITDPCSYYCGMPECVDGNIWHEHVLSEHYNPSTKLIGNYCRNGKQDFDETGVDCGGKCFSCM